MFSMFRNAAPQPSVWSMARMRKGKGKGNFTLLKSPLLLLRSNFNYIILCDGNGYCEQILICHNCQIPPNPNVLKALGGSRAARGNLLPSPPRCGLGS